MNDFLTLKIDLIYYYLYNTFWLEFCDKIEFGFAFHILFDGVFQFYLRPTRLMSRLNGPINETTLSNHFCEYPSSQRLESLLHCPTFWQIPDTFIPIDFAWKFHEFSISLISGKFFVRRFFGKILFIFFDKIWIKFTFGRNISLDGLRKKWQERVRSKSIRGINLMMNRNENRTQSLCQNFGQNSLMNGI